MGDYLFAKDIKGVQLFGTNETVVKIIERQKHGAYSPMTESGNYFILKDNGRKVLAHCFAHIKNPVAYESIAIFMFKMFAQ
jgi:hypothetical protein